MRKRSIVLFGLAIFFYITNGLYRLIITSDIPIQFTSGEATIAHALCLMTAVTSLGSLVLAKEKKIQFINIACTILMIVINLATIAKALRSQYATTEYYEMYTISLVIFVILFIVEVGFLLKINNRTKQTV